MDSIKRKVVLNLHRCTGSRRNSLAWLLAALVIPLPSESAVGQSLSSQALVPGTLLERVTSVADSTEHFALYIPTSYDATRPTPLLIVLDPRGRALLPLDLLRRAADRFGWVIVSSYNSRSDVAVDPNRLALNAMLADAQRLIRVDTRRLYLAGFSGTARQSWEFAYQLRGHVAGILGFGAGFPPQWALPALDTIRSPAFFGGAGNADFNLEEMMALDRHLDNTPVRHHITSWAGPHGWPSAEVMHHGVEWLEMQAIRQRLRPNDEAWVDSLYQSRIDSARALEATGDIFGAWQRYRWILADFQGLHVVADADSAAEHLGSTGEVRRAISQQRRSATRSQEYLSTLARWLEKLHGSDKPPTIDRVLMDLAIDHLQRESRDTSDTAAALAAGRLLEYVFVLTSSYEAQAAFDGGDPARALLLLELANAIHPDVPRVCADQRKALALLGQDTTGSAKPCVVGAR
jgi:predicted esterase